MRGEVALSRRQPDRGGGGQSPVALDVLGHDRLFEPEIVQLGQSPCQALRIGQIEGPVGVGAQPDPACGHPGEGPGPLQRRLHWRAELDLDQPETQADVVFHLLGRDLQGTPGHRRGVGIDMGLAGRAQQAVHRHAQRLAHQVPQRDVHRRQGLDHQAAGAAADAARHLGPQPFHFEGVGAQQLGFEHLLHKGRTSLRAETHEALAPAAAAVVGQHLDQQRRDEGIVARRRLLDIGRDRRGDRVGADVLDAQAWLQLL